MAKSHPKPDVELRPDGWQQFERAVDAAVKGGPMHRLAKPTKRSARKGRPKASKAAQKAKR